MEKNLILNFVFSLIVSQTFAQPQTEVGELGGIKYQAVNAEKIIFLTLPYKVNVKITSNNSLWSKKYYVIVSGTLDTEALEIARIRQKFQGYEVNFISPLRFKKIDINFGIDVKGKFTVQTPPLNAGSFTAYLVASENEGSEILQAISKGEKPRVTVETEVNVPVVRESGWFLFRSKEICANISDARDLGAALSKLLYNLKTNKSLAEVSSEKLLNRVTLKAIEICLGTEDEISAKNMSELLRKTLVYKRGPEVQEILRGFEISFNLTNKEWPVTVPLEVK